MSHTSDSITAIKGPSLLMSANAIIQILQRLEAHYPHHTRTQLHHELVQHFKHFQKSLPDMTPAKAYACTLLLCDWSEQLIQQSRWARDVHVESLQTTLDLSKPSSMLQGILEEAMASPKDHLDFLELFYQSLRLGYRPSFSPSEDELFLCIEYTKKQHATPPHLLPHLQQPSSSEENPSDKKNMHKDLIGFITLSCFLLYASLHVSLNDHLKALQQLLHL